METALQKTNMENAIQSLNPKQLLDQVALIQNVMSSVMKKDEHYGVVPGCGNKPALLKAGAEKLAFVFRLSPEFEGLSPIDLGNGHREYIIKTTLRHVESGKIWGQGVGSCSTMEKKYRYRSGPSENTNKPVPKEYWDMRKSDPQKAQEIIGGKGFIVKKENNLWFIFRQGESVENDCIADVYNTVLKMAKKRSVVDATLTATAASDIFTQDIEELQDQIQQPPAEAVVVETIPAATKHDIPAAADTQNHQNATKPPEMPLQSTGGAGGDKEGAEPSGTPEQPQNAPPLPFDAVFTGKIDYVEVREGMNPKTKKPWKRYGIQISDGQNAPQMFGTFDTEIGARACCLKGKTVEYSWTKDGKYKTLTAIRSVEPEAYEQREPGQD